MPGLLDILEAAQASQFDRLIVFDTSRLARDIGKLKAIERMLTRSNVDVTYVRQQFDDGPSGQLQKDIMSAVDSYERLNLVVRFALGKRAKIHRGLVMGQGRTPYGHRRVTDAKTSKTIGLAIDEDQRAVILRMLQSLRTKSFDEVANELTAAGIPTANGAPRWTGASVYSIINNPSITGRYVHGKTIDQRGKGKRRVIALPSDDWASVAIPPIVSDEELADVQQAIERRKRTHAAKFLKGDDDPFTLRGMLVCGRCGGQISTGRQQMTGSSGKRYGLRRYYGCIRSKKRQAELAGVPKCDLAWIHADELEAYASDQLGRALFDPDRIAVAFAMLREQASDGAETYLERMATIEREIARRRRAMDKATRELLMDDVSPERERSLRTILANLEAELGDLTRSLDALGSVKTNAISLGQVDALETFVREIAFAWEHATPAERREVFDVLQLRATVTPDPDGDVIGRKRYRIVWEGLIDMTGDQSQSMRLNHANSTSPSVNIVDMENQKPQRQSWDGVKMKFMP